MLNTPFGTIKIIADGLMLDYDAVPFCSKVRSGIAWATDHKNGDVRTWLAADPS